MSEYELMLRALANHICMFGTPSDHCGAPADIHAKFHENKEIMICQDHLLDLMFHGFRDAHPVQESCGMAGMGWWPSCGHGPGYCYNLLSLPSLGSRILALESDCG